MSKFKNIEALGIEVLIAKLQNPNERVVLASDLEALLEKGVRVYGIANAFYGVEETKRPTSTHTGLLIDYKPIPKPKPVTKEEITRFLNEAGNLLAKMSIVDAVELLKRIRDAGVE